MKIRTFVLILLGLLLLAGRGAATGIADADFPGNRKGKVIDADLLRIGIIPAIGGRVVELTPKKVNKNYMRIDTNKFHLGKNDKWSGGEYGGMCDAATGGWPGPFWGEEYKIEALPEKDALALRLQAEAEGIGITRDMIIPNGTTRLMVRMKQTNLTKQPLSMVLRLHGEFRVGTQADTNDALFWKEGNRIMTRRYIPGSENPRVYTDNPTDPWMAFVDTVEQEALIHRFVSPPGPYQVMWWSGHPEEAPEEGQRRDTGFYNNERFCPRTTVESGKSCEALEEFWVIFGLTRVDFCAERGAGGLDLPRLRYGKNDKIRFVCMFGAPFDGPATDVELRITAAPKEEKEAAAGAKTAPAKTLATLKGNLAAFKASDSCSTELTFDTQSLPDGAYLAEAAFKQGGTILGTATRTFDIVSALVENARDAIGDLQGKVNALRKEWKSAEREDEVYLGLLQYQVDEVKKRYDAGDYEQALETAAEVQRAIAREQNLRAREQKGREQKKGEGKDVFRRYRDS